MCRRSADTAQACTFCLQENSSWPGIGNVETWDKHDVMTHLFTLPCRRGAYLSDAIVRELTGLLGIATSIGSRSIGVRRTTPSLQLESACLHVDILVTELWQFSDDPVIGEFSLVPFEGLVKGSVLVIKSCDDVGDRSINEIVAGP